MRKGLIIGLLMICLLINVVSATTSFTSYVLNNTGHSWSFPSNASLTSAKVYNQTWLNFDGVNDKVEFINKSLNVRKEIPKILSFWVYSDKVAQTDSASPVFFGNSTDAQNFGVSYKSSETRYSISYYTTSGTAYTRRFNFTAKEWNHIVEYYNLTHISVFVNGVLQNITEINLSKGDMKTNVETRLGLQQTNQYFNGSIRDVNVFQTFLLSDDLSYLANNNNLNSSLFRINYLQDLPEPMAGHGMEYLNGKIYVAGGDNSSVSGFAKPFYVYNLSDNTWYNLGNLPYSSQSLVLRAVNNKLYYIGGLNSGTSTFYNNTYEYNPLTNVWIMKSNFTYPREDMASAVYGDYIYIFGGNLKGNIATNSSLKYNTITDTWTSINDTPVTMWSGDFGAVYEDKIYLISPVNNLSGYPNLTITKRSYVYNISDDSYYPIADIPIPVAYKEVESKDGQIWVFDGRTNPNTATYTGVIQVYTISNNSWYNASVSFPVGMGGSVCSDGNYFYISGGAHSGLGDYFNQFIRVGSGEVYSSLNLKLNENTGTTAYDSSGNGNNGTISGATWQNDGVLVSLTNGVDYTWNSATKIFTLINPVYAWSQIKLSYWEYNTDANFNLMNVAILFVIFLLPILGILVIYIIVKRDLNTISKNKYYGNYGQDKGSQFFATLMKIFAVIIALIVFEKILSLML